MRAIVMLVANVIGKKSFQLSLVPCDDVSEPITAVIFPPSARPLRFARDSGSRFASRWFSGGVWRPVLAGRISDRDHRVGIWQRIGKGRLPLAAVQSHGWWDAE